MVTLVVESFCLTKSVTPEKGIDFVRGNSLPDLQRLSEITFEPRHGQ